jgi:hypothetical protein
MCKSKLEQIKEHVVLSGISSPVSSSRNSHVLNIHVTDNLKPTTDTQAAYRDITNV